MFLNICGVCAGVEIQAHSEASIPPTPSALLFQGIIGKPGFPG